MNIRTNTLAPLFFVKRAASGVTSPPGVGANPSGCRPSLRGKLVRCLKDTRRRALLATKIAQPICTPIHGTGHQTMLERTAWVQVTGVKVYRVKICLGAAR